MLTTIITASPDKYERMADNYAAILEKTNNQLGLGINVANFSVAILSAFLATIAIIVGYYLWKNSQEQKKLFTDVLQSNQEHIRKQSQVFIEQEKQRIDNFIKNLEVTSKSSTEEKKTEIQKLIEEYKKEKASLSVSSSVPISNSMWNGNPLSTGFSGFTGGYTPWGLFNQATKKTCMNCGKSFSYTEDTDINGMNVFINSVPGVKKTYCPHCGSTNTF